MSLQKSIAQKLKDENLSALKASKIAGMSYQAFCNVAKAKSKPNARTLPGLAKLLGISVEEVAKLAGRTLGKINRGAGRIPAKATAGRRTAGSSATLRTVAKELAKLQTMVAKALRAGD